MKYFILLILVFLSSVKILASSHIRLKKGLIINSSVVISRETYFLNADSSFQIPLIIIDGKNLTVDFNNCILQGSNDQKLPNKFYGLAVLVKKGSSNVIIKNANIHGFKIAIMADSIEGLQIENCNLSYNYRQHLHSNWKREDVSDWMSYHHNEHDEWMRYGAGIYMKDCDHAIIKNNMVTGGQCGLMLMRCDSNEIYNNSFSFNSGIGIGLYRSSYNKIYGNELDFNVRGYSDGIYSRGQDSAGILVFEQCNNNVFAYNSATHGGDGFFLWAGQYTMDTGEGGCNDNWIYENDFSYAPTNGVEVTFSKNKIEKNEIRECNHGIWAGYSYSTLIQGNTFIKNKIAIAIEHGQDNAIRSNAFDSDETAIKLWSRQQQPGDWIYARKRDTRSRNYVVENNSFFRNRIAYDLMGTDGIDMFNNKYQVDQIYKLGERIENLDTSSSDSIVVDYPGVTGNPGLQNKRVASHFQHAAKNEIRITEWGPYDFHYPLLWFKNVDSTGVYNFDVLTPVGNKTAGNAGRWRIKSANGFHITQNSNSQLTAKADSSVDDRFIQLEYNGSAFADIFGKKHAEDQPYIFEYREFDPHFNWEMDFYRWDPSQDPQTNYPAFFQSLTAPVYSTSSRQIDYTWWGAVGKDLPADSFATVAIASAKLKEGDYAIGLTADDLAKVFVDGKELIDAWNASYTQLDETTHHEKTVHLTEGLHEFRIVHAEISGLATLMFYFNRLQ